MDELLNLDRSILITVNGWGSPFMDSIMLFLSSIPVWIPLYVLIAILFFLPKWYGRNSYVNITRGVAKIPNWVFGVLGIAAIGICFGLNDQVSVFIKNSVQRLRPSQDQSLESIVRLLEGKGSLYGFVSSHAANTFGLAVITSLIFKRLWYSIIMIIWATLISFSRIYLAKHYPLDVICGAILGIIIAVCVYYLWIFALKIISKRFKYAVSN